MARLEARNLAALLVVLMDFIRYGMQFPVHSDTCDHTVWDDTSEPRGVHRVMAGCSEGTVDWRYPYGAVRLTFQLQSPSMPIEACFKARTHYTIAKISLELDSDSETLDTLALLNYSNPSTEREICLQSKGAVTLYIEAQSDLNSNTIGHIEIEYDLQRLHTSRLRYDSMDECRPCTDKELLNAVCSSDFVVAGTMHTVLEHIEAKETEIRVGSSHVLRQRRSVFRPSAELVDHPEGQSQVLLPVSQKMSREQFEGAVIAPHKCGIRQGDGEFLFMGRIRLDRALVQCAPRREDFDALWRRAVQEGTNPCLLD